MARKARLTVFSRFLIMMLIVGPLAFLGASYYNGEDGLQTVKDLLNQGKDRVTETRTNRTERLEDDATYKIRKLEEEVDFKDQQLDKLYKENEALKKKVDALEKQLADG